MPVRSARIMALVVHPYIMGVPHRLRYFREALETYPVALGRFVFGPGNRFSNWYLSVHSLGCECFEGLRSCDVMYLLSPLVLFL